MLSNTIALALIAASTLYLLWCASWLIGRPRVQVVVLRHRSLQRAIGYPAGLQEGASNGRLAQEARRA
jgi:hypothetical protein